MLNIIFGDVIKAWQEKYDILVHGCNCLHIMGAGIAKTLANLYPKIYQEDKKTKRGDWSKLGTFQIIEVKPRKYICNAYTQFSIGHGALNIQALESCFQELFKNYSDKKICCPAIGMGLAGGNPKNIIKILKNVSENYILDIYILDKKLYNELSNF